MANNLVKDLSGYEFDAIPEELRANKSLQTHLHVLNLSSNPLKQLEPRDHFLPASLRELHLSGCSLRSLPDSLTRLTKLQRFFAGANLLTNADVLFKLPSLQHAGLSYNCIAALPQALLPACTSLLSLDINHNSFESLAQTFASIKALPSLQVLSLQGNPICLLPSYVHRLQEELAPRLSYLNGQKLDAYFGNRTAGAPSQYSGSQSSMRSRQATIATPAHSEANSRGLHSNKASTKERAASEGTTTCCLELRELTLRVPDPFAPLHKLWADELAAAQAAGQPVVYTLLPPPQPCAYHFELCTCEEPVQGVQQGGGIGSGHAAGERPGSCGSTRMQKPQQQQQQQQKQQWEQSVQSGAALQGGGETGQGSGVGSIPQQGEFGEGGRVVAPLVDETAQQSPFSSRSQQSVGSGSGPTAAAAGTAAGTVEQGVNATLEGAGMENGGASMQGVGEGKLGGQADDGTAGVNPDGSAKGRDGVEAEAGLGLPRNVTLLASILQVLQPPEPPIVEPDVPAKGKAASKSKQAPPKPLGNQKGAKPGNRTDVQDDTPKLERGFLQTVFPLRASVHGRNWLRNGIQVRLYSTQLEAVMTPEAVQQQIDTQSEPPAPPTKGKGKGGRPSSSDKKDKDRPRSGVKKDKDAVEAPQVDMSKYDIVPHTKLLGVGTICAGARLVKGGINTAHETVSFIPEPALWDEKGLRMALDDERHNKEPVAQVEAQLSLHVPQPPLPTLPAPTPPEKAGRRSPLGNPRKG